MQSNGGSVKTRPFIGARGDRDIGHPVAMWADLNSQFWEYVDTEFLSSE